MVSKCMMDRGDGAMVAVSDSSSPIFFLIVYDGNDRRKNLLFSIRIEQFSY